MSGHIFAFITATRLKWEATAQEIAEMEGVSPDEIRQRYSSGWHVDGRTGKIEYDDDGSGDYYPSSDSIRLEESMEEYGWIDRAWSPTVLHDSRNDVRPVVDASEDDEWLADEVQDALEWLEGGYEDNGDGTFHAFDSYEPNSGPWTYTYAVHFTRKFYGPKGWTEEPWHPFRDGRLKWHDGTLTGPHADYPHEAGTLYDCAACEKIMDEEG